MRDIYLYPSGEDAQALCPILEEFRDFFPFGALRLLDDSTEESSLFYNKDRILENGELWIVHQDENLMRSLMKNAEVLPKGHVYNGIAKVQEILFEFLKTLRASEILASYALNQERRFRKIDYLAYFVLQFWISLQEDSPFVETLKTFTQELSAGFREFFVLPKHCVGVVVSSFSANAHLGKIGILLEQRGVQVVYCYGQEKAFKEKPPQSFGSRAQAIFFPLHCSYLGTFLNVFEIFITTQMPLSAPQWGCKVVHIPHAYIDPIASLAQRKRPLDELWFRKKMGIGGFRVISSLSNYKIYEEQFSKHGFLNELVCGGYPSLDFGIAEYEKCATSAGGGAF